MRIALKRLDEELPEPMAMHDGDAGLDLRSRVAMVLQPGHRSLIPTGLAMAIPPGTVGMICPRSGVSFKGVTVLNAPGIVDSGYRGEIGVMLINLSSMPYPIERGDRIAQMVFTPVRTVDWDMVEILPDSDRGENGWGSTGLG